MNTQRTFILIACTIFFLSGCNQLYGWLDKVPFVNEADDHGSVDNDRSEGKETENRSNEADKEDTEEAVSKPLLESQYFNEIKEVDGKNVIQNPLNILALVNKEFNLPSEYAPEDLTRPNIPFSFGDMDIEKSYLRKEAAKKIERLFDAAEREGIELFAVSGYRSYSRQTSVFDAKANQVGQEAAEVVVAIPGSSEHQTGLAMDISSRSVRLELIEEFGETIEGQWLENNAHKFGFILRYPKGKESITGYQYEPWHFRYVGAHAATVIFEKQLTLEEYFNIVEKI